MTNITVDLQLRSKWFVRSMPLRFSFQRDGLRGNPIQTLILEPSANLCNSRSRLSYTRFKRFACGGDREIDKYQWQLVSLAAEFSDNFLFFFGTAIRPRCWRLFCTRLSLILPLLFASVQSLKRYFDRWLSWKLETNCSMTWEWNLPRIINFHRCCTRECHSRYSNVL